MASMEDKQFTFLLEAYKGRDDENFNWIEKDRLSLACWFASPVIALDLVAARRGA
jgi:hypothetical protein